MQQIINNGDSGLSVRNALNSMFAELYGGVVIPLKISGITGNTQVSIPANSWVNQISLIATSGTPTVRIGITANGEEIMPDYTMSTNEAFPLVMQKYFPEDTPLYITITGATSIKLRIDLITNYY